eukprot:365073-Chlamydomonas_euryale.AAC.3
MPPKRPERDLTDGESLEPSNAQVSSTYRTAPSCQTDTDAAGACQDVHSMASHAWFCDELHGRTCTAWRRMHGYAMVAWQDVHSMASHAWFCISCMAGHAKHGMVWHGMVWHAQHGMACKA